MPDLSDDRPVPCEQARAYVELWRAKPFPWKRDVAERREEALVEAAAAGGPPEPVTSVEQLLVDGVPARLYRPLGGERDVLVWLHGSAWMIGDLDFCDPVVRRLTNRARCAVLSVDYRLAPEHPFPAAIEDAWAATAWASERFRQVAVGGDSAGGNLAAAVALRARDRGIELALQVLVYPVLDYAAVESSSYEAYRQRYSGFGGDPGFGSRHADGVRYIWEVYVPDPAQRLEQDASPMQAAFVGDLAPALIVTAEHDVLRGEAEAYARRLQAEGVPVELRDYEGQVHGFFNQLVTMSDARDAIDVSAAALTRAFAEPRERLLPGT